MSIEKVLSSAIISIGGNILVKALGIISTVVMARVLAPEDFGLVAVALVVYEIFLAIGYMGVQQYILKQPEISENTYNACFTFRFISMNTMAILLALVAGSIADYYQKPIVEELLYYYSVCIFLYSLSNIHFLKYMRELNYKPIVNAEILAKIFAVLLNIGLALYLQDYRALIYGNLAYVIVIVIRSYFLVDILPKFTTRGVVDVWNFSKWLLFDVLAGNIRSKIDVVLAGRVFSPTDIGYYEVSKSNSGMLIQELYKPFSTIVLTVIADGNKSGAKDSFEKAFILLALCLSPIFVGTFVFMDLFILLLLGQKWLVAMPLFEIFLCLTFFSCFTQTISSALVANGRVKQQALLNMVMTFVIVGSLSFAISQNIALEEFALVRTFIVPMTLVLSFVFLRIYTQTKILSSVIAMFLFIALSALAIYPVSILASTWSGDSRMLELFFTIVLAAPIYAVLALYSSRILSILVPNFDVTNKLCNFAINRLPLKTKVQ